MIFWENRYPPSIDAERRFFPGDARILEPSHVPFRKNCLALFPDML